MRDFIRDRRGIEGLPMRLIIIVVVAAVVLAAILAMMPKTTPSSLKVKFETITPISNNVKQSSGGVVLVKSNGYEEIDGIEFNATIKITDDKGKPISGATVILSGAGGTGVAQTNGNGIAYVKVQSAKLEENQESAYMKVTVKASGYPDYIDNDGLLLQRVTS